MVRVPRRIAKDLKLHFNELSPQYKANIQKDSIHHSFIYEIGGEQVELPFLVTSKA